MRLSNEFIKKDWGKIQNNAHNYMVLDIEHLGYSDDTDAFETGVYVINLYNTLRMVNSFFANAGIEKNIETSPRNIPILKRVSFGSQGPLPECLIFGLSLICSTNNLLQNYFH